MTLKRLARAARNLVLIALISFGLGEVTLRLVNRVRPSYIFYDATYNRFRAQPGSSYYGFPTNSQGFHDLEFAEHKGNAYRIVALGDSFAFGIVPYEHNFLTLLEKHLSRACGRPVEVLNMGIPRTAPMDYLALFAAEGLRLDPDLVLLSFFIGNDLIETHRALQRRRPLHERSYVLSLLRFALLPQPLGEPGVLRNRRVYRDDQPTFGRISHLEILAGNAHVYRREWPGFEPSVDAAVTAIGEIARICERRDIALGVVLLPEETQLDPRIQHDLVATFKVYREGTMDYLQPNRVLTGRLEELGIDTFDLYPAFREASREGPLYKPRDTHWNIAGNRLAAGEIARFLIARELVPSDDPG